MKKSTIIYTIIILLSMILMTGCRCAFYGALGPQSVDEAGFYMERQVSDPNVKVALPIKGIGVEMGDLK